MPSVTLVGFPRSVYVQIAGLTLTHRLLDALPRTPTGKVQKGPLRDIIRDGVSL
jgi:acyl-CoA synthetase (AMP-forming)/AMP-acid ligase II